MTEKLLGEWYARTPDIRRLWAYEADDASENTRHLHVVVTLRPACDSDDTSPIWIAKCTGWHRQLERLTGQRVHLDWSDGNAAVAPRADCPCVANIAWRDAADDTKVSSIPSSNRPAGPFSGVMRAALSSPHEDHQ